MTDEAAIMLRVSLFGFVSGIVYWFVSYEPFGTVALLLLGAGPGLAGLVLVQERRRQGDPAESRGDTLRRLAGIPPRDPPGPTDKRDDDLGVLPLPTIWPFATSLGLAIMLTGLIYGLWLIVLGGGIAAYATWGWLAAINRENRYGRVQAEPTPAPATDPPPPTAGPGAPTDPDRADG
jgi:cytochrome c oxidase subunit IV